MEEPLVSIIIPTYNRAHLIGETLDSIMAQTYQNWECIVVDDGSTDDTEVLMDEYINKDARFQYHHRPVDRLPGGNAARNYGFEVSKGDYIQWFDSDDLMIPEKIELKAQAFLESNIDFVVSWSDYFGQPENIEKYPYKFSEEEVTFLSFTTSHISWITNDFMVIREIANKLNYNELLKSGQEFNYVAKLLLITQNLKIIKKHLTLRRYAEDSIGVQRRKHQASYLSSTFDNSWITFNEVYPLSGYNKIFGEKLLLKCIRAYLELEVVEKPNNFYREIIKFYKIRSFYFFLALVSKKLFNRYILFYTKLK